LPDIHDTRTEPTAYPASDIHHTCIEPTAYPASDIHHTRTEPTAYPAAHDHPFHQAFHKRFPVLETNGTECLPFFHTFQPPLFS
jgi:hypothetical protein